MAVFLSPLGGVGAQFFNNDGVPLSGGFVYTYAAGTNTPQTTYTSPSGLISHSNPIVLDSAGRVPTGEIWLLDGISYKFVIKDSNGNLIGTYDNLVGINSNFVNFTNKQEIQTATAGQTVFTLATMQYQPGTNSLSVFVDGVNQYGPGAQYAYTETSSNTVTFASGLHVGASVKFTTSQLNSTAGPTAGQVSFEGFYGQIGTVENLADDDGSNWIGFLQSGTGAVARSAQDKMRDVVSVKDFGAVGDGVHDDTNAFNEALAASNSVYVPPTNTGYKLTSQITIPQNAKLFGGNRNTARLIHAYSGTMIQMDDNSSLADVYLDGQGATYAGKGVVMTGTNGRQTIQNCKITDFADNCIYFGKDAGSQCSVSNLIASQRNGTTGSGKYAIAVENSPSTGYQAVPRKFVQIETNGFCAFDFGGANDFFVTSSFIADLNYSTESRAVLITNTRIANQVALSIKGANHTIVGCDIAPAITIDAIDNIAIQGNSYNNLPIVNNTGNVRSLIDTWSIAYTPTISNGTTAITLGNGTVAAYWGMNGGQIFVTINFTVGSTTVFNAAGELRFSVPKAATLDQCCGQAWMNDGATNYTAIAKIGSTQNYVALVRDTSGSVTGTSPATWNAGDFIRLNIFYV